MSGVTFPHVPFGAGERLPGQAPDPELQEAYRRWTRVSQDARARRPGPVRAQLWGNSLGLSDIPLATKPSQNNPNAVTAAYSLPFLALDFDEPTAVRLDSIYDGPALANGSSVQLQWLAALGAGDAAWFEVYSQLPRLLVAQSLTLYAQQVSAAKLTAGRVLVSAARGTPSAPVICGYDSYQMAATVATANMRQPPAWCTHLLVGLGTSGSQTLRLRATMPDGSTMTELPAGTNVNSTAQQPIVPVPPGAAWVLLRVVTTATETYPVFYLRA